MKSTGRGGLTFRTSRIWPFAKKFRANESIGFLHPAAHRYPPSPPSFVTLFCNPVCHPRLKWWIAGEDARRCSYAISSDVCSARGRCMTGEDSSGFCLFASGGRRSIQLSYARKYRLESSGTYYALFKRAGKQIRPSLRHDPPQPTTPHPGIRSSAW